MSSEKTVDDAKDCTAAEGSSEDQLPSTRPSSSSLRPPTTTADSSNNRVSFAADSYRPSNSNSSSTEDRSDRVMDSTTSGVSSTATYLNEDVIMSLTSIHEQRGSSSSLEKEKADEVALKEQKSSGNQQQQPLHAQGPTSSMARSASTVPPPPTSSLHREERLQQTQASVPGAFRQPGNASQRVNNNNDDDDDHDDILVGEASPRQQRRGSVWERLRGRMSRVGGRSGALDANAHAVSASATGPYLVTATLVEEGAMDTVSATPVASSDKDKGVVVQAVRVNKQRRKWIILGFGLSIIAAIVLAVTLGVKLGTPAPPDPVPTVAPNNAGINLPTASPTQSPNTLLSPFAYESQNTIVWGSFSTCTNYTLPNAEIRCNGNGTSALSVTFRFGVECVRKAMDHLSCGLDVNGVNRGGGGIIAVCAGNDPPPDVHPRYDAQRAKFNIVASIPQSTIGGCDTVRPSNVSGAPTTVFGSGGVYMHLGRMCWNNASYPSVVQQNISLVQFQGINNCLGTSQLALIGSSTPVTGTRADVFCYQSGNCASNVSAACSIPLQAVEQHDTLTGGDYTKCYTPKGMGANFTVMNDWLQFIIQRRQAVLSQIIP